MKEKNKIKNKIIVANWKMNPKSVREALALFEKTQRAARQLKNTQTVICPPAVFLSELSRELSRQSSQEILLGAQDVFWEMEGAFTGEISPFQLSSVGAKYVLIGHSERRELGDTDEVVAKKLSLALKAGFFGILCVGEKTRDTNGAYFHFIESQIKSALGAGMGGENFSANKKNIKRLLVAYEPIWAISSTPNARPAKPADFFEMSIFIRKVLSDMFGNASAKHIPVLYGGSTNEKNTREFLEPHGGNADGLLVGRASLDGKKFGEMLKIAETIAD